MGFVFLKGFWLHSCSEGFLAPSQDAEEANIVHQGLVLKGHFAGHHQGVQDWGGDSRLVLSAPQLPTRFYFFLGLARAIGDNAICYFFAQAGLELFALTLEEEAVLK